MQSPCTLTSLHIDFGVNKSMITVPELLSACSSLSSLIYSTTRPLLVKRNRVSELSFHPLTNLELRAASVIGVDIEVILQQCTQLRRLVMSACTTSVLEAIDQYAPKLEILGYNTGYIQVPSLEESVHPSPPGLQELYAHRQSDLDGAAASVLLPLIYRHRFTLQHIYASPSFVTERDLESINRKCPHFKLEGLISLALACDSDAYALMLNSIRETTTLKSFHAINVLFDLDEIVDLLMHLPPVTKLQFSLMLFPGHHTSLIRLFERYALLLTKSQKIHVLLTLCPILTDDVLAALADIASLTRLTLARLDSVTVDGMTKFLYKMNDNLRYINLTDMHNVTDTTLIALGNTQTQLEHIVLRELPEITDQGLKSLLNRQSDKLDTLGVMSCPLITKACLIYANQRVRNLKYTLYDKA